MPCQTHGCIGGNGRCLGQQALLSSLQTWGALGTLAFQSLLELAQRNQQAPLVGLVLWVEEHLLPRGYAGGKGIW